MAELTRQSLTNIKNILAEVGLTMENVVKTSVFLADMADFAEMNAAYAEFSPAWRLHVLPSLSRRCRRMPALKSSASLLSNCQHNSNPLEKAGSGA